jgi:hypothetical protein
MKKKPHFLVVYGSLYLGQKESVEYAEKQIAEAIANCPALVEGISVVFDVVASVAQLRSGFAHRLGRDILGFVDDHYPTIGARIVGLTDDDRLRPGRDRVLRGNLHVDNVHQFLLKSDLRDIFPIDS